MRYKFPLRKTLQVMGEGTITVDRFGNETMKPGVFEDVQVFGWEIKPVQEIQGDSILRTIDTLEVFMAPEDAPPPDRVGEVAGWWRVAGGGHARG